MTILIESISFDNLLKARKRFEEFRQHLDTDQNKAGAIQAFEYTYKLVWHSMDKLIKVRGGASFSISGARDIFRAAAYTNLIEDPQKWFTFHDVAILTNESFDPIIREKIIAQFDSFSHELAVFLQKLSVDTATLSQRQETTYGAN